MVVMWYRGFLRMAAILYGLLAAFGITAGYFQHDLIQKGYPKAGIEWLKLIYVGVALPLAILAIVAAYLPRRRWTYTAHAVYLLFNLVNLCFLPIMILMLVGWSKPETRAYFAQSE